MFKKYIIMAVIMLFAVFITVKYSDVKADNIVLRNEINKVQEGMGGTDEDYILKVVPEQRKKETEGSFILPLRASKYLRITSPFGVRRSPFTDNEYTLKLKFHNALDITSHYKAEIIASGTGKVLVHFPPPDGHYRGNGDKGGYIEIQYGDYVFCYSHLSVTYVNEVARPIVYLGDPIARMGSTGKSTGQHLHLEVYKIIDGARVLIRPLEVISNIEAIDTEGYITLGGDDV